MRKGRLEAFSDCVISIIITIMVLQMKAPEDTSATSLLRVLPVFLSYVLSFIYVAISWINHHQVLQSVETIGTKVLWANMYLLFWLSLVPFTTSWLGENNLESFPVALYGGVLFMCSMAFHMLEKALIRTNRGNDTFVKTFRGGVKEKVTMLLYFFSIPLAYVNIGISIFIYLVVALMLISPSRTWRKAFIKD